MLTAFFAAFVGFTHSLSPSHWLPVVLMARKNHWKGRRVVGGALIASSGHVLVSCVLGLSALVLDPRYWKISAEGMESFERYAGLGTFGLGLIFAIYAFFSHSHCHGHEHHGPSIQKARKQGTFLFLFSLGIAPCGVALPVFLAAGVHGPAVLAANLIAFSLGVMAALISATLLATYGLFKLDHPLLEHYGEVVTGLSVALLGILIYFGIGHDH